MRVQIVLLIFASIVCGQVASDYYNKPQQELFASVSQESTYVHKAGFSPCYKMVRQWAYENRTKYDFLSVTSLDSIGIVRVTSSFDCQNLFGSKDKKIIADCNLILTSCSGCLKIGFADLKYRACGALWRSSITKELISKISALPDSIATPVVAVAHLSRGIDYTSSVDSIFEAIHKDSLAQAKRISDSLASVAVAVSSKTTTDSQDMGRAQRTADSLQVLVTVDSSVELDQARKIFKSQLTLKGKIDLSTKLECLDFMLSHKLRTEEQAKAYLTTLKQLYSDRQALYYAVRVIVPDAQKYLCVLYYKKAMEDCGRIQVLLERFTQVTQDPATILTSSVR